MRRASGVAAALLLGALGCTSFPEIEAGECGNVVLEPEVGEACDTLVDGPWACRPPGDPHQCQYDCSPTSNGTLQACPPGFGCASDNVCRLDSGGYAAPIVLSSDVTDWLSSADFDGDARRELVSAEPADQFLQARFRLHYFGVDGSLQDTRVFPRVATRPIARDMNGDGEDDLVFSTARVGMVAGRPDREWLPSTFSSYQIPESSVRVVNVRKDLVGAASPLVAITTQGDESTLQVPNFQSVQLDPVSSLPAPVQDLAGRPIAADVFEGLSSPCAEVVLGYRDDDHLDVFDMCETPSDAALPDVVWRDHPLAYEVRLPPGFAVATGALSADVNGDGHVDLIVGATRRDTFLASDPVRLIAFGDGQSLEPVAHELELQATDTFMGLVSLSGMPLAAGDLSGDGVADFVFPSAIVSSRRRLSDGELAYFVAYENRGTPWTMAEIGDLNENGFADVVAATEGHPGVMFVNGSGRSSYVGIGLASDGPVELVTTGDFDGDLVRDLAYVERGKPTENTDYLAVSFGNGLGTPSRGRRIAAVKNVEQLGSGTDLGLDALFLVSTHSAKGSDVTSLTLFEGNPERLPLAPYALVRFRQDRRLDSSGALALMAGTFVRPASSDVLAFGFKQGPGGLSEYSQWLLPDIADGLEPPVKLQGTFTPETTIVGDDGKLSVSGAAMDLDGDHVDEALWLLPEVGGARCFLFTYDIDARSEKNAELGRLRFDEPCPTPELRTLDLDDCSSPTDDAAFKVGCSRSGDRNGGGNVGRPAVAALVGNPASLRILWSDGSGRLSLEQSITVPIPGDEAVKGFDLSPDGQWLAVVTATQLYVVSRGSERGGHPTWQDVRSIAAVQDARSVAVIDPNYDHVPAIAVAGAEGILLFEAALRP